MTIHAVKYCMALLIITPSRDSDVKAKYFPSHTKPIHMCLIKTFNALIRTDLNSNSELSIGQYKRHNLNCELNSDSILDTLTIITFTAIETPLEASQNYGVRLRYIRLLIGSFEYLNLQSAAEQIFTVF